MHILVHQAALGQHGPEPIVRVLGPFGGSIPITTTKTKPAAAATAITTRGRPAGKAPTLSSTLSSKSRRSKIMQEACEMGHAHLCHSPECFNPAHLTVGCRGSVFFTPTHGSSFHLCPQDNGMR
ncbi:hypothetical protein FPOAC1_012721 [Fusarium poae]|uniref:hypothetical protein n=1 Tax=Fusarium poae TaxID=36050 RepID=UPI001CEA98FB|nr:hypothetical protein FPOAC1_012721 [Fusarium poae]KAG8667882.1 hypothetical protein FPOAC1_012721 [Fusarium poae]